MSLSLVRIAARPEAANAEAQTVVALAPEDLNLCHFPHGSVRAAHLSQVSPVARVPDDLREVLDDLLEVLDELSLPSVVFQAPEPELRLFPD